MWTEAIDDSVLFPVEFVQLLPQAGITAYQCYEIGDVDQPGSCIGGIEKCHRTLLLGSSNASRAKVSSTSRFIRSSPYRDQHTSIAKHRNASQLISNTCSMRLSIEPPPPITGWGCCVRKNQIEKYTSGTSNAPKTAS